MPIVSRLHEMGLCPKGHRRTLENTVYSATRNGGLVIRCRVCMAQSLAKARARGKNK